MCIRRAYRRICRIAAASVYVGERKIAEPKGVHIIVGQAVLLSGGRQSAYKAGLSSKTYFYTAKAKTVNSAVSWPSANSAC